MYRRKTRGSPKNPQTFAEDNWTISEFDQENHRKNNMDVLGDLGTRIN